MRYCLALFFPFFAFAIEIPKDLSEPDRVEVVETVGLGSAPKMLTNPLPLSIGEKHAWGIAWHLIEFTGIFKNSHVEVMDS